MTPTQKQITDRLDYRSNLSCLEVAWEPLVGADPQEAIRQMQQGMAAVGALLGEHAASLYCQCQGEHPHCRKCLAIEALAMARLL